MAYANYKLASAVVGGKSAKVHSDVFLTSFLVSEFVLWSPRMNSSCVYSVAVSRVGW